jgi:hypothetical protein
MKLLTIPPSHEREPLTTDRISMRLPIKALHDDRITNLPIDFNLQELQLADQYNDEIVTSIEVDSLQAMPTQPFDIDETLPPSTMPTLATAPSLTSLTGDEDDSEVLPHQRAVNTTPTRFRLALGLWRHETGISRPQYKALLEILPSHG